MNYIGLLPSSETTMVSTARPTPPLPTNEARRLEALRGYQVLDTSPQRSYDDLNALATQICGAPIGVVSLVDADRQWFKSRIGLRDIETPRADSFCAWTILGDDVMVVHDAREDARFRDSMLVRGGRRVRFYAGAPLLTSKSDAIGALCVMDTIPRQLTPLQVDALRTLAHQVMVQLELRRTLFEMADVVKQRQDAEAEVRAQAGTLRSLFQSSPLGIFTMDPAGRVTMWNPAAEALFGWREDEVLGERNPIVPAEREQEFLEHMEVVLGGDTFVQRRLTRCRKDGEPIRVTLSAAPIIGPNREIRGVMALVAADPVTDNGTEA